MNNLEEENKLLKKKIQDLEEKLKSYTNNEYHQKYYDKNKEEIKKKSKEYMERIKMENPEKLKEWRRNAYLKRKEKNK